MGPVIESRGLPAYPPEQNVWQYPPPPIAPRWKWAAIGVIVLSIVAMAGLVTAIAVVGPRDAPGLIEDRRIVSVIERECAVMASTVESMPVTGARPEQAQILGDQNRAIENMLSAIRNVDDDIRRDDLPTNDWLDDWDALLVARQSYAEQLVQGYRGDLVVPNDPAGDDIYRRMNDVWLADPKPCKVPTVLLKPYPEDTSEV